jgi:tRNA(fMet)-specific endonuclease VapC
MVDRTFRPVSSPPPNSATAWPSEGSTRLARHVETVLGALDVLPFEAPADVIYGGLRADLERRGQPTGGNDLLIAAHALVAQLTLVTDDRGFAAIPELLRENWLAG